MPIRNSGIADFFDRLADLLEISDANPFRVRAYRNAARAVANWPQSLSELLEKGESLPQIPGIGKDLAGKIEEIIRTGKLSLLDQTERKTPPGLAQLLRIPSLGPKRVKALHHALKIRSLPQLEKAATSGKIRELRGFGPKTEESILRDLKRRQGSSERIRLATAEDIAEAYVRYLKALPDAGAVVVAGSYRRRKETVGDLDILSTCPRAEKMMDRFVSYEEVDRVLAKGETKSSVLLKSGIQVDLRVVPEESLGAALHYFTGSKAHNIAVRGLGVRRKLKINEYGIFKGRKRIGGASEEEVFAAVGLPYIEPELREMSGELDAALNGNLPRLLTLDQVRGDLHAHTQETDGRMTLQEMAIAAKARGYEYLAITDHSRRLTVAKGLDEKRLMAQIEEIDRTNEKLKGLRLLKGIEVDILEDGSLDLPNRVLSHLDLTVCSVHYKFNLPREKQTTRILRAMDNPFCTIIGHATGRLINRREAYDLDVDRILSHAAEVGVALELNAQPERMDLNEVYCRAAKDLGVKIAISTDAHSTHELGFMRFGVYQARRGWLRAEDVVNTRSLADLRRLFSGRETALRKAA